MRHIDRIGIIGKIIILFILLVNIVDAQVESMAQNNTNNTGFAKDLVVYLPVSKVINGINDSIIDISMQNPSNDTMYVQINVSPPTDIYIYGEEGFNQSGNSYMGSFLINPGQNKATEIRIKSDKTGTYSLEFDGQYWFSSNPNSKFSIKPYTLSIDVKVPSINAKSGPSSPVTPPGIPETTITPESSGTIVPPPTLTPTSTPTPIPDISIVFIFLIIAIIYLYRKYK